MDSPEEEQKIEQQFLDEFGFTPNFLSDYEIAAYYDGFSNGSLWPILHYNLHLMKYDGHDWDVYQEVNARFANKIIEYAT